LTKTIDEGIPKYHMPLQEANKIIEENMQILNAGVCGPSLQTVADPEPTLPKHVTKPKIHTSKNRMEKIMHKLYDLEPDNAPEKKVNLDLDVDLYQMESY
jgi:hypothetical protein